ncbi:hypothetical protein ES703_53141 [subsurface metagenome]
MESAVSEIADVPESAVAAAVVTSVHKIETTQQVSENNSGTEWDRELAFSRFLMDVDNSDFLNTSYRERRLKKYFELVPVTESVLAEHDSTYDTHLLVNFWKCRTKAWAYYYPETKRMKSVSNSCRGRWCPMCAKVRVNTVAHNCFEFLIRQKAVRFLTLTMEHSDLPLDEQIRRVKKCFIRLCRRVFLKKYVDGTIAFLHVKENEAKTKYHVHLHIFITGSYVPQKQLSAEWKKVTGDSIIVYVQAPHTEKELRQSVNDFARYAGCPTNLRKISKEHRLEVIHAFQGIRACWTTGKCRAVSLSPPKYEESKSKGVPVGRLYAIQKSAGAGDLNALEALFVIDKNIDFEGTVSFWGDDGSNDKPAGFLSPVEPLPLSLFSANERSPPGAGACHYESDESVENAPW